MKRSLQLFLGVLSLVPLTVSVLGLLFGAGRLLPNEVVTPNFDSHYRYVMGYHLSLTLLAWWIIPNVEKRTAPLRIVSAAVFAGGVGRLVSAVEVGVPGSVTVGFTLFELCFPLALIWQAKLPETPQPSFSR